jgi:subtilisin family serine protease/uncharacterized membrane protein
MRLGGAVLLATIGVLFLPAVPSTQGQSASRDVERINNREAVAREVLVKFRQPPQRAQLAQIQTGFDAEEIEAVGRSNIFRLRSKSHDIAALLASLSSRADVEYAEPNFVVHAFSEPNDPLFPSLWGLRNVGQAVNGTPAGSAGSDISALEAWDIAIGSRVNVVAVVDTGINYAHSDLIANVWSAPSPFTVTIGGVSITCAAGTHGFNAIDRTCDPMDDHNHGTHVSGTIGASGHNGIGVTGVNWIASIMGLKFLNAGGSGTVADAVDALEFAIQVKEQFAGTGSANIRVLSNSWGGGSFSQALLDEINAANSHDMLFVAAAGNSGLSNDIVPAYPASYNAPNVVAVAATTNTDARAFFSNYGGQTVHLGAPGVDVLSTIRGEGYAYFSGTSMATPHVSGAAALVLSQCPLGTSELKATLVDSVDFVSSLASLTIAGGRLNVTRALQSCTAPPGTPTNLVASGGGTEVRLSWSAATGATSYRVKRSLTSQGPYAVVASNIKSDHYLDTGLTNGTTYYYVVSAVNRVGESGDSTEVSATPNIPGDLLISSFTVPAAAGAGSTLVVSATTKNQGAGTSAPSTTRFYLSDNATVEPSDFLLDGNQPVSYLAPGATLASSVSLSIPAGVPPGQYILVAKADADDVLFEDQEGNNTRARLLSVGPDLTISMLTVPTTGTPGTPITVSHTVKNQGGGSASASSLRFFWSNDSNLDAGDTLLTSQDVSALGPNVSVSGETTLTIPSGLGLGTYYVIGEADGLKVVAETQEGNNAAARAVQIGPDLIVSAFTVPSKGGGPISVTDTTTNQGSANVPGTVIRFYLSANSLLDANDTLLQGSRPVAALVSGGSDSGTTTVTIPLSTSAGTYYVIAKADADNVVLETQEGNNTLARSIQIGGDLVVSALTAPSKLGAGVAFTATDTTKNQGGGNVGASLTQFYFSTDALLGSNDPLLNGSRAIEALGAGEASTGNTTLTIPSGTAPGSYYLFAKADNGGAVTETQETNNTAVKVVTIGPDLAISTAIVTASVKAGLAATVNDTVINQGGGDAGSSSVRYYLSTNYTLDASDPLLAESRPVPALAAGVSSSGSTSVTIPAGTAPGTYYIFVKADGDGSVVESSETNNAVPRGVQVTN